MALRRWFRHCRVGCEDTDHANRQKYAREDPQVPPRIVLLVLSNLNGSFAQCSHERGQPTKMQSQSNPTSVMFGRCNRSNIRHRVLDKSTRPGNSKSSPQGTFTYTCNYGMVSTNNRRRPRNTIDVCTSRVGASEKSDGRPTAPRSMELQGCGIPRRETVLGSFQITLRRYTLPRSAPTGDFSRPPEGMVKSMCTMPRCVRTFAR